MAKVIMIMVDGISADYFEQIRHQLPHMHALALNGTQVNGVSPEVCGTSFPGRTSIVTGVTPNEHGIYGNMIWDGEQFRYSNADDVRVPTLTHYAREQGRDVACLGYGMVKPRDCSLYIGPWWADEMLMRGRDEVPTVADAVWLATMQAVDERQRLKKLSAQGLQTQIVKPNLQPDIKLQLGMLADHQFIDLAGGLAALDDAPDFILLEIAITDYFLHKYGDDHPLTEWSLRTADAQIGTLMEKLRQVDKLDDYNLVVLSDHGHAPMNDALYIDRLLGDDVEWVSEGSMLLVKPRDADQLSEVTNVLADYGVTPWEATPFPIDQQQTLAVFAAPEGSYLSMEKGLVGHEGVTGPSKYLSNHGMRPGTREDERFCLFYGPNVPVQTIDSAEAIQVAPTMAALLGVETPWAAAPIFQPI